MVYLNTEVESLNPERALEAVSPQRREAALRYVKESDRKLSLAAYRLLQEALEKEYGIREAPVFGFGPHGKPFLRDFPHIHFNLSHCPGVAMCAVDTAPVGCDVEAVPAALDRDLCSHVCNAQELEEVLGAPSPERAFTTLWTRKEAFLKYTGEGLTDGLKELLLSPAAKAVRLETVTAPDGSYVYTVCRKK